MPPGKDFGGPAGTRCVIESESGLKIRAGSGLAGFEPAWKRANMLDINYSSSAGNGMLRVTHSVPGQRSSVSSTSAR